MIEACENCVHCKELYRPPSFRRKALYGFCCTLFVNEDRVMYLEDGKSLCECFEERGWKNEQID